MQSRVLQRFARAAVLVLGTGVAVVSTVEARPSRPIPRAQRSGFNLFAGSIGLQLAANRVNCNWLTNFGNVCTNPFGSGTIEAGFWPNGSPDSYVFNGGLQVAGVVQYDTSVALPNQVWRGDTVGAFFMDPRGDQRQGDAVTNIYDGLNANDLAVWPSAAYVKDSSLYNSALLGRQTISQQDSWVRYWDGNPSLSTGRKHAMGMLVEQRGLLWNYPSGNQDILYFLFRFINITATDSSAYQGLSVAGYTPQDIDDIIAIANDFHSRAQAAYGVNLPSKGYTFHNMFAAFFQDPDEGVAADHNFSTAVFPFSLVSVMKSNYSEPLWQYPANIFSDPFFPAPGFEAVKYLKSPINPASGKPFGISVWGNTTNGGQFPDAVGVSQMYRFISGHPSPSLGDGTCNVLDAVRLHTCYAAQAFADTRFFESSGPLDLAPGQSSVIVVAMIFAAPVHKWAATSNGIYALSAGQLETYDNPNLDQTYTPGWPGQLDSLALVGAPYVRSAVERPMGWGQFSDVNGDGVIDQTEVQTVPRSLLGKALTAQAIFDNKFLLPFAPEAPPFYLVPGDGQVTVTWGKSPTETVCGLPTCGDPYFQVAKAPFGPDGTTPNALYDPNYRQYDVAGYRVYRGRTGSEMTVIAQFDYAGDAVVDYTGQFYDPNVYGNQCAPELGVTTSCPTFPNNYPLVGNVIQVPPGGRVQLSNGNILIINADTAVTGGASGLPALVDNGVPFAYVDRGLLNGVQYFYSVSAFDINSVASGPSSLQSALALKSVTPRAEGINANTPVLVTGMFGDDNTALDPNSSDLKVDEATGAFSGLVPPVNGGSFGFGAFVAEALPPGDITARIDSVGVGFTTDIATPPPSVYVSFFSGSDTVHAAVPMPSATFAADPTKAANNIAFAASSPLVKYDTVRAKVLGIPGAFAAAARIPVTFSGVSVPLSASDPGNALINGRYGAPGTAASNVSQYLLHAVWYDEGGSEPPQPTVNPFGSKANSNGTLTGVDIIYEPAPYRVPIAGGAAAHAMNVAARYILYSEPAAYYPADFVVTWNADSSITVRDSTHHVFLPFRTDLGPGWGFVNERVFTAANLYGGDAGGVPTVVGYRHGYGLSPACDYVGSTCTVMQNKAEYEQIDYNNQGTATGSGITLYIDGMFFMMQMTALPAAGTKWHLKAVSGILGATCPTLPTSPANVPTACSAYSYTPAAVRPAYVPGLQYKLRVTQAFGIATTAGDMSTIHTVPDPYYVTNALETSANNKILRFVNLPNQAIIRIYSVSGILVRVLTHNDPTGGGETTWDLRNRNNQFVASGVYFYHVEAPDGHTKIGRLTVVNYAQ